VTAAVHLPAVRGELTNYDDDVYVTGNPDVQDPDLARTLDPRHHTASDWTPLVPVTHAAEYGLFGFDPLPYHVTNWLLHVAITGLVYGLSRTVGVGVLPSLLAGLVFGVHPLQVENVAWVSSRKTLLTGLFGMASVLLALRGRMGWACISFLMAAASKGTAVVFPLWIAAALLLGFGSRRPGRRELGWLAVLGLLAALRATVSTMAQAEVVERTAVSGLAGRLAVMGPVLATQLRQLVAPIDLGPIYPWAALSPGDPQVLLGWGLVLAVAFTVIVVARRDRHVALFGAFAGLGLLPTLNLWPAPFLQADRYVHLSLVGGAFLLVRAVQPLARLRAWVPSATVLVWCALVAIPLTVDQTGVWRTSETLWLEVLRRDPDFPDAHANLGEHYLRTGQSARARAELEQTLALRPGHGAARFNLALLHLRERRLEDAEETIRPRLEADPDDAAAQALVGRILLHRENTDTALRHLDRALLLDPGLGPARLDRAHAHARARDWEKAASDLQYLISEGRSTPSILNDLAAVCLAQGNAEEAADLARRAVAEAPGLALAWDTLAAALLTLGGLDEAEQAIERGLAANPNLPDLRYEALELLGEAPREWRADARRLAR
jgi:tetratricopeptide (TPR) repeat protein